MTPTRRARPAITLVEMMVTMALTLVIMLILTESFKLSLDFVRGANSTGQMMYQLNGAGVAITRDLKAEHFLREDNKPNGGVRLSDQRFDRTPAATPPKGGFFRIEAPAPAGGVTDAEGFVIRTATNHRLHFSVVLSGANEANQGAAQAGGATYRSRVYEVAYFLVATGTTPGGQQLHDLVRRQRLAAPTGEGASVRPATGSPDAEVISVRPPSGPPAASDDDDDDDNPTTGITPGTTPNTLGALRNPLNRLTPLARLGAGRFGEDILASNVLSFEVMADWSAQAAAGSAPGTPPVATAAAAFPGNSDYPYQNLTTPGGVFDTHAEFATPAQPRPTIRIKQLMVTVRVHDPRMRQSRQSTWKVAM